MALKMKLGPPGAAGYRILCLGAHCDDIEIGCGGTLLKLIETYPVSHVRWVVFASDARRKQEAIASAGRYLEGVAQQDIVVLDYRDAFLSYSGYEIKDRFEAIKREFTPDLIFTHYRQDRHQDHRLLSDFAWNTFRDHCIWEYEIPKYDGDLGTPNTYVELSAAQANKKIDIILESFRSQEGKHWFDRETFLSLMRIRGVESACLSKYAEAFHVRKVVF